MNEGLYGFPLGNDYLTKTVLNLIYDVGSTWQKPSGYSPFSIVRIRTWGGGGGANGGLGSTGGGGGGQFCQVLMYMKDVPDNGVITIGAPSAPSSGAQAGQTSFCGLVKANGGFCGPPNVSGAGGSGLATSDNSLFLNLYVENGGIAGGLGPLYFGAGGGGDNLGGSTAGTVSLYGGSGGNYTGGAGTNGTAPGGGAGSGTAAFGPGVGASGRVQVTIFGVSS